MIGVTRRDRSGSVIQASLGVVGVSDPDTQRTDEDSQAEGGVVAPVAGRKGLNSRTLIVLIVGWVVVFGVLAAVLTSLKLGGTEPLKSDDAPTPGLPAPEGREG